MSGIFEIVPIVILASSPICAALLSSSPNHARQRLPARTAIANRNIDPSEVANEFTRRTISRRRIFPSTDLDRTRRIFPLTNLVRATSAISTLDENIDVENDTSQQGTIENSIPSFPQEEERDEIFSIFSRCKNDKEAREEGCTARDSYDFDDHQYSSDNITVFQAISRPLGKKGISKTKINAHIVLQEEDGIEIFMLQ